MIINLPNHDKSGYINYADPCHSANVDLGWMACENNLRKGLHA